MTQTNLEQYALTQGISKSLDEMTEAEKVQLRYSYVMEKTANATGDYARTGGGFANQLRTLTENFKQLGAIIGQLPMKKLASGMKVVNDALAEIQNILSDGFQSGDGDKIMKIIENLIDKGITALEKGLPVIMPKVVSFLNTIIESVVRILPKIAPALASGVAQLMVGFAKAIIDNKEEIFVAIKEIIVEVSKALYEGFTGNEMSGDLFAGLKEKAEKVIPVLKKLAPAVIGVVAAFKGFKAITALTSMFGGKEGGGKGGFVKMFKELGETKPAVILKGMANLAIIIGGITILTAALMAVAPYISKLSDGKSIAKLLIVILAVGAIGTATAKMSEVVGKIPVSTVAKGLANMAIMLAGLGALAAAFAWLSPKIAAMGSLQDILKVSAVITVLGVVGTAMSVLAGIVGIIPVATVALGLANMAIVLVGLGALTAAFLWLSPQITALGDIQSLLQIAAIMTILGTVGTVLTVFAGIAGVIPIPVVLAGLANMALVLGGITGIIVAFGALTQIEGFNDFIAKGGEILVSICDILGQMVGSLVGGAIEKISSALPTLGENLGAFGENVKPLFSAMKGVDLSGAGAFFTSIIALLGIATGNEIVDGIKKLFGGESSLSKLGTELSTFATKANDFFKIIAQTKPEAFSNASSLFKSFAELKNLPKVNQDGKTAISAIANDLSTFDEKASGFFDAVKNYDTAKVSELWASLKEADDVAKSISGKVTDEMDSIVKKAEELPKEMAKGINKSGKSLSEALVSVWKDAVNATVSPVNKLLSGANWILKQFGSEKTVGEWKPYAKGTDGHRGGNALVNDGRGAELVQMPNGRTFIPNGRNVFIPNAPHGMKVLSAERTAALFGKRSPTFRYADGVGDIDVWSYADNAKGLISAVKNAFVSYGGMSGLAKSIGSSMVNTIANEMPKWASKLYDEVGTLASYVPSKGVEQWRSTVARALKMEGQYSASNIARTLFQMKTESGGDPRAINLWDSNAKKGIPSKGLMQVIDPTFRAYARDGYDKNIYDPLSNILASVRYATSRYGSLAKAYRGVGYSSGVGTVEFPKQSMSLSYTPENRYTGGHTSVTEHNTFSPQFNLTITGASNERDLARKVKRWVSEAMNETFDSMERKSARLQEV